MTTALIVQVCIGIIIAIIGAYVTLMQKYNKDRHLELKDDFKELKTLIKDSTKDLNEHVKELYSKVHSDNTILNVHENRLDTIEKTCIIHHKNGGDNVN